MGKPEHIDWVQGLSKLGGGSPIDGLIALAGAEWEDLNRPFSISDSVGVGGKNKPGDVMAVQNALNRLIKANLSVDGNGKDSKTIAAIKSFQMNLGLRETPGLVKPGGLTAVQLAAATNTMRQQDEVKQENQDSQALEHKITAGQKEIDTQFEKVKDSIRTVFKAYQQGLMDFGAAMVAGHMEKEEGEQLLGISIKVLEVAFAVVFPEAEAAKVLGELGAKAVKEITVGVADIAKDRLGEAAVEGEGDYRAFLKEMGDSSIAKEQAMVTKVTDGKEHLQAAFEGLVRKGDHSLADPAELFLKASQRSATDMIAAQKKWHEANNFEKFFVDEFAGQKAAKTGKSESGLGLDDGTLWYEVDLDYKKSRDTGKIELKPRMSMDNNWQLRMENTGDARGAVKAILESYKTSYVWQIKIRKKVLMRIYDGMSMTKGVVLFTKGNTTGKPDGVESVSAYDPKVSEMASKGLLLDAWNQIGRSLAMKKGMGLVAN